MNLDKKYTIDEVKKYWTHQSLKGQDVSSTWSDYNVVHMEIKEILKRLQDGDNVLDVGCNNGYSTVQYAATKNINIRGIDFIPELIQNANLRLSDFHHSMSDQIEFDIGDVISLKEPTNYYDKVISTRVIINLVDWNNQKKGLLECIRVLKPGGEFLLSESTLQGWNQLNKFRTQWGLLPIPMPPFNQYLDQEKTIKFVIKYLKLIDVVDFASTYFIGTRVLKPLLIKALGAEIDNSDMNMEWNKWFSQLPSYGDYGVQKLFIFKKL